MLNEKEMAIVQHEESLPKLYNKTKHLYCNSTDLISVATTLDTFFHKRLR